MGITFHLIHEDTEFSRRQWLVQSQGVSGTAGQDPGWLWITPFLFCVLSSGNSPMSLPILMSRKVSQGLLTTGCWDCRQDSWAPHTTSSHHHHPGHSAAGLAQSGWSRYWSLKPGVNNMWMWGRIQQACMGDAQCQLLQGSLLLRTYIRSPFVSLVMLSCQLLALCCAFSGLGREFHAFHSWVARAMNIGQVNALLPLSKAGLHRPRTSHCYISRVMWHDDVY